LTAPLARRPPRWLKFANRINVALLRRGVGTDSQRLLSVPGRTTGVLWATPVAIVEIDGDRYIVAGWETSGWVQILRRPRADRSRGASRRVRR
jgi:hypothetical protein